MAGPALISSGYITIKVALWHSERYGVTDAFRAFGKPYKDLGIVADPVGRVLKGHNKFPGEVFFFDGFPITQISSSRGKPQGPCFFELIEYDQHVKGPWLCITPVSARHKSDQIHVREILDHFSLVGMTKVEVSDKLKLDHDLVIDTLAIEKRAPERAIVELPPSFIPDNVSLSLMNAFGMKDPEQYPDISLRIAQGFLRDKIEHPEGYKIGEIELLSGVLEVKGQDKVVGQIVLHPEKPV